MQYAPVIKIKRHENRKILFSVIWFGNAQPTCIKQAKTSTKFCKVVNGHFNSEKRQIILQLSHEYRTKNPTERENNAVESVKKGKKEILEMKSRICY